ncbi:hypothetical protein, partial [Parvibaculum sp.]|uniref:hypothetical protein n=1 Tax=Parvibaculum sp. TaxID=2024848 RepID=UPI002B6FD896
ATLAVAIFLWESYHFVPQADDAFISYRYAANLLHAHELVFNIGEYVEGYTNLLWTLLIALGMALGLEAPTVGYILSAAFGGALLLAVYFYTLEFLPRSRRWLAGVAPLCLLSFNSFACWTSSGLETPLFAFLVVLAFHAFYRRQIFWVMALCILATLTRPEGAILALFLLGSDFLTRTIERGRVDIGLTIRDSVPSLCYAGYIAAHTIFRIYYYGDPLPNTFYAKVGDISIGWGWLYLRNFLVDGPALLIPGSIIAAFSVRAFRLPALYVLATAAYVVWIGGDVFRLGRFMLPVLPFMVTGAIVAISLLSDTNRAIAVAFGFLVVLSTWTSLYGTWPGSIDFANATQTEFLVSKKRTSARDHLFHSGEDANVRRVITAIESFTPPATLVASVGIGRLGYFSGTLPILDLVGLVDRHIAHSGRFIANTLRLPGHFRTDSDYVLSRKPDVILIPMIGNPAVKVLIPAIADLWKNPRLEQEYYWDAQHRFYRIKPEFARTAGSTGM